MFKIDENRLNSQEQAVLDTLSRYAKNNPAPKIVEAARVCGCSVSQVSKAVKKAGFGGYKKYLDYLYFGSTPKKEPLHELQRLKRVIDDFDPALVDDFAQLIRDHDKIVFFGYGPSLICAQYFEYKLRFCIDAFITTPPDETSVRNLVDESTLLAIFTTTGQYRSFEDLWKYTKSRGSTVVVVSEEFNSVLMDKCDHYLVLSHHKQPDNLLPHEKTRTVFFIFFEEVIRRFLADRASQAAPKS